MNRDINETIRKANALQAEIKEVDEFNRWILCGDTSWRNGGGQWQVNCFLNKQTTTKFSMFGWLLHGYGVERKIRIPNTVLDAIADIAIKHQTDLENQLAELLRGEVKNG